MQLTVVALQSSERFRTDYRELDPGLQAKVRDALDRLMANPRARSLRCHTLKGLGKPTVYKIDVDTDKAYQVTFILDGTTAVLLRVATHRQIDRDPR